MASICRLLEWDTAFFGVRVARLLPERITPSVAGEALTWCREREIACLYFLADPGDRESLGAAHEAAFRLVDIRMTFEMDLLGRKMAEPAFSSALAVRTAVPSDLETLRSIAGKIYETRFHRDPGFAQERANALYQTWIETAFDTDRDSVQVATAEGIPCGYITCERDEGSVGRIGLVGIDPSSQGVGVGGALVHAALRWFVERGLRRAEVVTQGANVRAQRLYQRIGFVSSCVRIWYHRWFQLLEDDE